MNAALLIVSLLVPLAVSAYLAIDARRVRREAAEEARKERESMRLERESFRDERAELLNRVMWALGKPYEEVPIWKTSVPGRTADEEPDLGGFEGIILESELPEELLTEA